MRKLSTISVQPRSWALIILGAIAFMSAVLLALFFESWTDRLVSVSMTVLGLVGVLLLFTAALLEQRRRYVRRIGNMERKLSTRLTALSTQLATTAERTDSVESLAAGLQAVRFGESDRIKNLELRSLDLASVLAHELPTSVDLFTGPEAVKLSEKLIDSDPLRAFDLLEQYASFSDIPLSPRRQLAIRLRALGYLAKSLEVLESVTRSTKTDRDERALLNRRSELSILTGNYVPQLSPSGGLVRGTPGHVLHVVGKSLPQTQSGYTLRTHYIARAQKDAGLRVSVVSQSGEVPDLTDVSTAVLDDVEYYSLPGGGRTTQTMSEWLDGNVAGVLEVVQRVKPAVLHAHSDFFNALTAQIVGAHCGIPVVYESRGFWEESWLSRVSQAQGIEDWDAVSRKWGMPDAYTLRAAREAEARAKSAHVFTLARVMQEHIEQQGLPSEKISLTPNAVSVDDFPVLEKDGDLLRAQGIRPHSLVVGYISSIVEYEGIDTLLEAFAKVQDDLVGDARLLVVGDGPFLPQLKEKNRQLGGNDVIFTGRVSHDEVLRYYSLIDVFVVPRRPSRVCQLVTPLKPFEAFSTGRAVIMSDVKALKEIADDSQAAGLFVAGDAQSLAEQLKKFLVNDDLRKEMASKGAAWVREVRTWDANAIVYKEVYEALGVMSMPAAPELPEIDDDTYRRIFDWIGAKKKLIYRDWFKQVPNYSSANVIEDGWKHSEFPSVSLDLPIDWSDLCLTNRSWAFKLHTWEFMDPVIRDYLVTKDVTKLQWCADRALSWLQHYVWFNASSSESDLMAWYDMSLGLRSPRLASLIDFCVDEGFDQEIVKRLLEGALRHAHEHSSNSSFNPRTNHGYYAAVGQVVLAKELRSLPGMEDLYSQGQERLALMAASQFISDGIHSEHSPDYHRMLLDSFRVAVDNDLITDKRTTALMEKAAYALSWMITPNGNLVQFGDSPERTMTSDDKVKWDDPHTMFLRSLGRQGEPDPNTLAVYPLSGYAFVRDPQPVSADDHKSASYLALAAAFHSRAHKHADDLTMVWSDRGQDLLVDGGRFGYADLLPADSPLRREGYYYAAPERQYVESTIAHNTVEADGRNHDRRRKPFGSALEECFQDGDEYTLNGFVDHGHWSHHRQISFSPGQWLIIEDQLTSKDGNPHDFRAWFNVNGALSIQKAGSGLHAPLDASSGSLWISSTASDFELDPVRGQEEPMRGWRSQRDRSLTPTWSFNFGLNNSMGGVITTVFNFGEGFLTEDPRQDGT